MEPLAVFRGGVPVHILHAVEAAGLLDIRVGRVDLAFVALVGPAVLLVGGVEVDAGVGALRGHHIRLELEVPERAAVDRPDIEEVAAVAVHDELAVFHFEGALILAGPPAFEAPGPIEQSNPSTVIGAGTAYRD